MVIRTLLPAIIFASLMTAPAACVAAASAGKAQSTDRLTTYGQVALKESAEPVHPGVPGKVPFWNGHSKRFIYAPAFDFKTIDGATKYQYTVKSEKNQKVYQFESDKPSDDLGAIWTQVPVGYFTITVTGLAADGTSKGEAGKGRYYRASPFNGPYHEPPVLPYDDSAQLALKTLLHKDYVEYWFEHQKPDPDYALYRYPSKIYSALVIGAVTQARLTSGTAEAARSLKLAHIIADFMLSIRYAENEPWANQVPTYWGERVAKNKGTKSHMQLTNHLTTMGVDAGNAFLDLYDITGETKYLDAAKLIAETYKKTQGPEGSWPLFVDHATGKSIAPNVVIPTAIINYYDRLRRDYKVTGLKDSGKKAFDWVMANPVKTFNWQGQFEDVKPRPAYENQSREQACELAMYLFRNKGDQKLAEDLVRFAEDQFVIWEQPMPHGVGKKGKKSNEGFDSRTWMTPSVQEQYVFWNPVGRSAGIMVETFWVAYKATGKELYKAKAMSMANSFPNVQKEWNGDYPTFFTKYKMNFWLNSVVYPAKVLMNLERELGE